VIILLFGVIATSFAQIDQYNVVWNSPGANSHGSMPVGNGDIALNAWIEKSGDLVFYIGKNDAWSEACDMNSPGYGGFGLIKVGRVRVSLSPNPFASGSGFRQELHFIDGTFEASAGPEGKRSRIILWVDANRPVIHVQSTCAEPVSMRASFESWRTQPTEWLGADTIMSNQNERVVWYYRNSNKEVPGLINRTIGAAMVGNGLVTRSPALLESATPAAAQHLAVHTLTSQSATPAQWLEQLDKQMIVTDATPLDVARQEHVKWWSAFWDRSHVFITNGERARDVTAGYIGQRYINACTSRGEFPIKFNGSLFVVEGNGPIVIKDKKKQKPDISLPGTADWRAWGFRYWFQNTRAVYWSMMASGDFDLMHPFFRMYRALIEDNAKQVRECFGHGGAYFMECGPFWGGLKKLTEDSPGGFCEHYYTPILEYSAMALDYFAYTGDKNFARNTLIPMADLGLTFFSQHFKRDAAGKLSISPANAIETYWKVTNPATDVAGLHWVIRGLLELPEDIGDAAMRERWKKLQSELPPVPTGDVDGKKLILAHGGKKTGHHNMENPELYAVYPFRVYGLGKPDFELAMNTFNARRNKWYGCWSQNATQAALLGDAGVAKAGVIRHLAARDRSFKFPGFWPAGFDYAPDQDNGGNGMHALHSMLVQFDGKKIVILPAWPSDWDVNFKLKAPYQTTISCIYSGGKIALLEVTPQERRKELIFGTGVTMP